MLFTVIKILKMLGIVEIAQPIGEDRQEKYVMTTLDFIFMGGGGVYGCQNTIHFFCNFLKL
jgi:hypothetical protein